MTSPTLLEISEAVERLRTGHVVAYPTEAVYGLGCDPHSESAIRHLLSLNERPESAGFVLVASHYSQLQPWVAETPEDLLEKAMQSWPGPKTWLFPRAPGVSDLVAGSHDTIAVRITAHKPSIKLCNAFGAALISTSANPRALEPARSAAEVADYFGAELGGILAGPLGHSKRPSEIRDLISGRIIRNG
jgi:L-threonylcarbamoyladenylate synthase